MCGSGRPSSAGRAAAAAPPAGVSDRPRGLWVEPFDGQEGVRAGDECGVVVEAEVAAAFVVVEPKLAFQLPVVELDRPAQSGEAGEPIAWLILTEVGKPVVSR